MDFQSLRYTLHETVRAKKIIFGLIFITAFFCLVIISQKDHAYIQSIATQVRQFGINSISDEGFSELAGNNRTPVSYAIFAAHTPNGDGLRAYDYAFYLPLTALTWERIGFVSFVVIIGSKCEWENDPTLRVILAYLKDRKAVVTFIPTPLEHRNLVSQTARIFGANMDDFPGLPHDYLIQSDADLWPIARKFYERPPGKDIVLVHGHCCGTFLYKAVTYPMYPMGNIGATVSTWRQILNEGHRVAKDAEGIVSYYEDEYGAHVRQPVKYASAEWFYDQKLISVRITQWIERYGNESVIWIDDGPYTRVDRAYWRPENLTQAEFELKYDVHLPQKLYNPQSWNRSKPLMKFMFGVDSWEIAWADQYAKDFYATIHNFV